MWWTKLATRLLFTARSMLNTQYRIEKSNLLGVGPNSGQPQPIRAILADMQRSTSNNVHEILCATGHVGQSGGLGRVPLISRGFLFAKRNDSEFIKFPTADFHLIWPQLTRESMSSSKGIRKDFR